MAPKMAARPRARSRRRGRARAGPSERGPALLDGGPLPARPATPRRAGRGSGARVRAAAGAGVARAPRAGLRERGDAARRLPCLAAAQTRPALRGGQGSAVLGAPSAGAASERAQGIRLALESEPFAPTAAFGVPCRVRTAAGLGVEVRLPVTEDGRALDTRPRRERAEVPLGPLTRVPVLGWDEWVPESRVLKYVDTNLQKQRELQKANQEQYAEGRMRGAAPGKKTSSLQQRSADV
ncbi:Mortality factor 4-like protein 1 [Galemys pyrenaicus]|uniref:Mortality factor 4-like protein 1 n=1 Tax=Galemys pyrenaicus TaxID=202257 RepID=A0A8J6A6W2_GALPY|nr:Mortality factor 4-like protein 1 [Galemys pyrenaicus]